jgi:hypothetical protein
MGTIQESFLPLYIPFSKSHIYLFRETNLKIHRAVPVTMAMSEDQLVSLRGSVGAEPPNKHFTFKV